MPTPWTEEDIELLRRYWREGLPASLIARLLRPRRSRNSVIGKVWRLDLPARDTTRDRRRTMAERPPRRKSKPAPEPVVETAPVVTPPVDRRQGATAAIMDLRRGQCRYPIGDPADPDFRFCAAAAIIGKPYCHTHALLCLFSPRDYRRQFDNRRR